MKDRRYLYALYLFFVISFASNSMPMYVSRYLGVIGLDNGQIGLIAAVPALAAIFAQPVWGVLADRSPKKKYTIVIGLALAAACAFAAHACGNQFVPLLVMMSLLNVMMLPSSPVSTAIAIEHTSQMGASYSPVRMAGTIGYQLCILFSGFLFDEKLSGFMIVYGVVLLASAACAMLLPNTRGHQYGGKKVSPAVLLRDKQTVTAFAMAFLVQVAAQFFNAFFTKHLGDLGIDNGTTGLITTLVVILEIPFLLFLGDKIYNRLPILKWMWLGMLINGVRFVALSYASSPWIILLTQLPAVALFACIEFFPVLYLSRSVDKEVLSTAQSMLTMVSFGLAKIVGTSVGGFLAESMSLGQVFRLNGWMLVVAAAALYIPLIRKRKAA